MIKNKNKILKKRNNESRHVRFQPESTFEIIDDKSHKNEYYLDNNNSKKRKISSEENNINNSFDIGKLTVKKRGKRIKIKNRQQEEIDKTLIQLERSNKEKMIKGDLAILMEEIENENKDFKKKVFFSNFHDLNNHLGVFDDVSKKNKQTGNYIGIKDDQISSYGLIDKYTEKAKYLKKYKK